MQALNKKWYDRSTDRTRTGNRKILLPKTHYFTIQSDQVIGYNKSKGIVQLKRKGPLTFKNKGWTSIQVGRYQIFQLRNRNPRRFRMLKINTADSSFTIEKSKQHYKSHGSFFCLVNFFDRCIFVIGGQFLNKSLRIVSRFDTVYERWKVMPELNRAR